MLIIKDNEKLNTAEVLEYKIILSRKKTYLFTKRILDILFSVLGIVILSPIMIIISVLIKVLDGGEVLFKQERYTKNLRKFTIIKFRTMSFSEEDEGNVVTRLGKILRKYRVDEIPQLFNILKGEMSFVGTRPEIEKYVKQYSQKMYATLLLPAGLTSRASIEFRNENELLSKSDDAETMYISEILPKKMEYNLEYFEKIGFIEDFNVIILTFLKVFR